MSFLTRLKQYSTDVVPRLYGNPPLSLYRSVVCMPASYSFICHSLREALNIVIIIIVLTRTVETSNVVLTADSSGALECIHCVAGKAVPWAADWLELAGEDAQSPWCPTTSWRISWKKSANTTRQVRAWRESSLKVCLHRRLAAELPCISSKQSVGLIIVIAKCTWNYLVVLQ